MRTVSRTLVALLAAALALAGCGGSNDDSSGSSSTGDSGSSTASLVHVDGTIKLDGDTLTITPTDGSEPHSFSLGPAVVKAEVLAVSASGAPARVTYRDGEDIAAAVTPAPTHGDGVQSYEGEVVSVTSSQLVIDGKDGERTFDISGADTGAFDTAHLTDHKSQGEPIRVYFKADAPDQGVAYEDA
ncbi:MAG: hypothetical protein JWL76_2406 [Thermoleophilia bacterium]|nr:hypothetical protein [Thermoleophilia bacterium]